ncbi:hypothetical protein SteCoe_998 [Stentor coeruleus]|uniref:RBR-type E3 ubiquitin transferase n=1 Tax=Stentor coeruleus TaxID=5963 RepID=A0A1R2D2T3_9CILI|nr:hypothetical protein SteCoe_998 [Stentor coeruleus]
MLKGNLFYQCKNCLKLNAATLPCDHQYCQNCIVESSKKLSLNEYIEEFHCPDCKKPISINFIRVFFMEDEEFILLIDKFTSCAFCEKSKRKLIELSCLHRLCEFCLHNMINTAKNISEIICKKCNSDINPAVYKDLIPKEKYEALFAKSKNLPLNANFPPNIKRSATAERANILNVPNRPVHIPKKEIKDDLQKKKNPKVIQLSTCDKCKKNEGQTFNCPHKYCLECLRIKAEESYKKGEIDLVKCDCGIEIPETAVAESFGSRAIYLHNKEKYLLAIAEEADAIKFTCGICMGQYKIENGITLDCDHRYCEECMKQYFTERINSSNVSDKEFVCPDCQNPVEHNIIRGVVGEVLYEKYLNFAFRNWKPEEGNILKFCAFCDGAAEIPADLKVFKCPKCKKTYCPQCNQKHDKKITCDDFAQMGEEEKKEYNQEKVREEVKKAPNQERIREEEKIVPQVKGNQKNIPQNPIPNKKQPGQYAKNSKAKEQQERKIVKKVEQIKNSKKADLSKNENSSLDYVMKNCKQCPKCKQFVERDSGCNFIKCRWPGCTDSYFCFLCGIALTAKDHYSHYKLSGPFGKTCNKIDGIKE